MNKWMIQDLVMAYVGLSFGSLLLSLAWILLTRVH